uniref:Secreted protein n=1 Tax=Steinernema glaseri TaxID=37863 RepID=A0A1I7Y5M8_9BILA
MRPLSTLFTCRRTKRLPVSYWTELVAVKWISRFPSFSTAYKLSEVVESQLFRSSYLLWLPLLTLATVAHGQYAAVGGIFKELRTKTFQWPATSYSPFVQALLAPHQHPVPAFQHGTRYFAFSHVIPGLFAANRVPRVIPHGPPRVVSYQPALSLYG